MAQQVAEEMREPYPELLEVDRPRAGVIRHEEERFAHTIDIGLSKLEEDSELLRRNERSSYPQSDELRARRSRYQPL